MTEVKSIKEKDRLLGLNDNFIIFGSGQKVKFYSKHLKLIKEVEMAGNYHSITDSNKVFVCKIKRQQRKSMRSLSIQTVVLGEAEHRTCCGWKQNADFFWAKKDLSFQAGQR